MGYFHTQNTHSANRSIMHSAHLLSFPVSLSFPISLIIFPGASASHIEIKVAVTHTASGGWFRSISLQYIIPLWMMKACILGEEMTLLRGKCSRGRYTRPPSEGIGLQGGRGNTWFGFRLSCKPIKHRAGSIVKLNFCQGCVSE